MRLGDPIFTWVHAAALSASDSVGQSWVRILFAGSCDVEEASQEESCANHQAFLCRRSPCFSRRNPPIQPRPWGIMPTFEWATLLMFNQARCCATP